MRSLARSPLLGVLYGVLALHIIGIGWGLPATEGWDNDGVAPRDFLVGVVQTFTPGEYYTYPPLHVLLLSVLTCPVWIAGMLHAPSLSAADLVREFLTVPTMTAFALVARTLSVAMSLGIVFAFAKIGEELRGRRAGVLVATVVGLNAPFAYYAHTSNLDVPYCFWAAFALLLFVRAVARREPAQLRRAMIFAALATATKDQAAALFILGFPLALAFWAAIDSWARDNVRAIGKQAAKGGALALVALIAMDGAVVNPTGFRSRIAFLLGTATEEHATYAKTFAGRAIVLRDSLLDFDRFYPAPFAILSLLGVAVALGCRAPRVQGALAGRARQAAGLAPMFCALSFFALFNCLARRTDERFLLPQMLIFGMYAGVGLDAALFETRGLLSLAAKLGALPLLIWALFECAAVDVALLRDTRYDAEAWLAAHVRPGEGLEVYGNQVYLPRLPSQAHVMRIDPRPAAKRNPLVGATEVVGRVEDVDLRKPDWIVVTDKQMWLGEPNAARVGRVLTARQVALAQGGGERAYFGDLLAGRRGYVLSHVSEWTSAFWPRVDFHGSTSPRVFILQRVISP